MSAQVAVCDQPQTSLAVAAVPVVQPPNTGAIQTRRRFGQQGGTDLTQKASRLFVSADSTHENRKSCAFFVDRHSELSEWAELLGKVHERKVQIYAYANNHYAGYGPATVRMFRDMWRKQGPP
jgi:uncharacterized protein YecE (DUF72 family)